MHDHDDQEHSHNGGPEVDLSNWAAGAEKATCPACGASGALTLGGGLFCPTCGAVTTNPGYEPAPPADADPD